MRQTRILYHMLSAQSCPTLWDPMSCSPPASSVHGISQARILQWVAVSFSRGSSWSRDWTQVSCIAGGFFTVWTTIWAILMWIHVSINHDKCCEGRPWWSKSWLCRDGIEEGDGTSQGGHGVHPHKVMLESKSEEWREIK